MGEFFSPKVTASPPKYLEHNCESFAGSFKFNRAIQLENYILFGGEKRGVDTHKITSKKSSEFTAPSDSITKRFHPDAGVLLYKRFMEEAVQKMKGKKDPESKSGASAYDQIFYASNLLRVKPAGLMALLYCENSALAHGNTSRNLASRLKGNADRGLFQISDGARLSMNEPAFINEFLGVIADKGGACPRLGEMAGFFGIKAADYASPYELAKALIGKITEYDAGEFNKGTKKYGIVGKDKAYGIKYNTFAASILFSVNLAKYEGNYQLAAGSYKRGRAAVNGYLEPKAQKLEKRQGESGRNFIKRANREKLKVKGREDELADYSHKFWSYFSAFDAYHSGAAHFKEFKDEVAYFYDRTVRENPRENARHD